MSLSKKVTALQLEREQLYAELRIVQQERDTLRAQQAEPAAVPDLALRARVADLLHLLQFAKIETPSHSDAAQAEIAMNDLGRMLSAAPTPPAQQSRASWTRETPTEQDRYWYWDGHEDTAPINVGVFWSPVGCFVHAGQLGITQAIDCKEWDGWWLLDETPLRPGNTAAPEPAEQQSAWVKQVMEQAQVFASAWSLVGGPFDTGNGLEQAEEEKERLRALLGGEA